MLAERLIHFYHTLSPPRLPRGIGLLHPQLDPDVMKVVSAFFKKYYADNRPRKLLLGINPGRFGAGITGVNFTAPRQLKENCSIKHHWKDSSELSAEFIYMMIDAYGGPDKFYHDYFLGSMSPLGFTKAGKNINYYDDEKLASAITPFVVQSIQQQLSMGMLHETCYCIGGEKNFRFLEKINSEHKFFNKIVPLPHPRFIMQYKRKSLPDYIRLYLDALKP